MFCQIQGQAFFHRKLKAKSSKKPPTIERILFPPPADPRPQKEEDSGPLTPHFKFSDSKKDSACQSTNSSSNSLEKTGSLLIVSMEEYQRHAREKEEDCAGCTIF